MLWVLGTKHNKLAPYCNVMHITKPSLGQRSAGTHKVSQALATWKFLEAKSCIVRELVRREFRPFGITEAQDLLHGLMFI